MTLSQKHHLKWKHDVKKIADRIVEVLKDYLFIFISSLFKADLRLVYKKPMNKLPSNNDNDKTEYLIVTKNQHVANRFYITYMGNQASTFLFFVWKIWDYHNFLLFQEQLTIFLELCKIWSRYRILQN